MPPRRCYSPLSSRWADRRPYGRCSDAAVSSTAAGELRDDHSWFSSETKIELCETTAAVLEKPDCLREIAVIALDVNVAGGLKVALRPLGSPQFVVRNIVRAIARFVSSHVLELETFEDGHAVLGFSEIGDSDRCHRLDCVYTAGLRAVIPCLFGLPLRQTSTTISAHHQVRRRASSAYAGKRAVIRGATRSPESSPRRSLSPPA